MSLNFYRDEAGDFLKKIGAVSEGVDGKIAYLEQEFNLLKAAVYEPIKFNHQIYDMLFLLFELAHETNFDIDAEWAIGKKRKEEKYIRSVQASL